jgi:hypothetical protein
MNKTRTEKDIQSKEGNDILPEYDFTGGVRGKHYRTFRQGYTVTIYHPDGTRIVQRFQPEVEAVVLEPDVRKYFPDSEAVNQALRGLIALIPKEG